MRGPPPPPAVLRHLVGLGCLLTLALLLPHPAASQEGVDEILDEIQGLLGGASRTTDPAGLVAAELSAVEAAAGMKASGPITTRVVTRDEAHAHVARLLAEQLPPARLEPMEYAWKAMGLLAPDASLAGEIERLFGDQAGGFYDPATGQLVLLGDLPSLLQVPVVRHELVHALQDQTWGLVNWLGDAAQDEDRGAAMQAVLEGHATDVMNRVTLAGLGLDELMKDPDIAAALEGLFDEPGGGLDASAATAILPTDAPPFLVAQLLFPYLTGATFVAGYREAHPDDPGCRNLYERPPRTSAEVLDPALWEAGTFRPALPTPGTPVPGFEVIYHTSLGRLLTWVLLTEQGDPSAGDPLGGRWGVPDRDRSVVVGSGWQGDRVAVLGRSGSIPGAFVPGSHAVVWASVWRDAAEAERVAGLLKSRVPSAVIDVQDARLHVIFDAGQARKKDLLAMLRSWE
jgi:hypothetical protein